MTFGLVVQALDAAAGKQLLSPEVVEDQLTVLPQGSGGLLQGLDTGPLYLSAPFIDRLSGLGGGVVIPKLLKSLREKLAWDVLRSNSGASVVFFSSCVSQRNQIFTIRSRRALLMTETELRLIAAPAMTGLSSKPKNG